MKNDDNMFKSVVVKCLKKQKKAAKKQPKHRNDVIIPKITPKAIVTDVAIRSTLKTLCSFSNKTGRFKTLTAFCEERRIRSSMAIDDN